MKYIFTLIVSAFLPFTLFAQTELKPTEKEVLINFLIADPKGIPEEGAEVLVEATDKKFSKRVVADLDGKCQVLVPKEIPFKIVVYKFDAEFDFGEKVFPSKPEYQTTNYTLSIEIVTSYKRVYTLDHLFFNPYEYDTKGLKPTSLAVLNKLADTLKANTKMKIEIAGHTDNSGEDLANLQLSQKRADAIRAYLIQKGIKEDRILAKGYGETSPIVSNDTQEGRSFNRRTEVKVIEE